MRYVAAYLLATLGAKTNPSAADIDKILSSVGIESDGARVKQVLAELAGKDINEIIATGQSKLASMPSGGGAVAVASVTVSGGGDTKPEVKKEEKKQESESEDDDMGFGLFD